MSVATHKTEIDGIVAQFFSIFNNKDLKSPDWGLIYQICIPEARILKTSGLNAAVYDLNSFMEPRIKILTDGSLVDFEEKETEEETVIINNIAQRSCKYRKKGILNGQEYAGTGNKLFHLVNTKDGWKIAFVSWEDD